MFKRSASINPQALKADYSGIERAAAIKQKTLADLGGNIAQGIKSFQKKKEDKLKKESALKVIGEYAKMSGSELTEEELKGVYGNLDADTILQQGEILKDLARYEKEENQRVAQQEAMIKAAKRANKLAQARNAIAQRQADTSLLGMQTTAAQNAMGNAIKDKEIDLKTSIYNTENTDKTALSNSLRHVAKQDGGGSLISFLDKYAEEGGKDTTEAIRTYQGAFPGSKRYTAEYKDRNGKLKTAVFVNGQRIDIDDRDAVLKGLDNAMERLGYSDKQKNETLEAYLKSRTSSKESTSDIQDTTELLKVIFGDPRLSDGASEGGVKTLKFRG
jgi:hypothetical protein|tara:strand:- start:1515 stop:2507 length:993 start_codon:yes stop_codon:yes gene_type:complete